VNALRLKRGVRHHEMALLFILVLFAAAVAIAHFSVLFIERPKASLWKAAGVVLLFMVFNNVAQRFSLELPAPAEWVIYIAFAAFVVWVLFRLKPLNNVTVAACYVVGRWALVYAVSLLPLETLNA
jgi:phosphate starvation-inducible membrane PsiE